jgi:hypothetical protein
VPFTVGTREIATYTHGMIQAMYKRTRPSRMSAVSCAISITRGTRSVVNGCSRGLEILDDRHIHGRAHHFLDALGVYYYDLPRSLPERHRQVLLTLERYLYD